MRKERVLTAAATLMVVGLLGLGSAMWAFAEPPWQRFQDGSQARLEGITIGKAHAVVPGPNWRKEVCRLFPTVPAVRPRWTPTVINTPADTTLFWVLRQNQPGGPHREERVTVADEHGCESQAVSQSLETAPEPFSSGRVLCAYEARAFPRRGDRLFLRFYERSGGGPWEKTGQLAAGNPNPGRYPAWTPHPLPQERESEGTSFTLTRLITDVKPGRTLQAASEGEEAFTLARFRITRNGRVQRHWQPVRVRVSDAAGNDWQCFCYDPDPVGDEQEILLGEQLWSDESAWKLKVEFQRSSAFLPEEMWTVRNVPVPAGPHRNTFPGESTVRFQRRIELRRVAGAYANDPQDYTGLGFPEPSVHVRMAGTGEGVRVLLWKVREQCGSLLKVGRTYADNQGRFSWAVPDARPGSRVNLTFAIQKTRSVEYLAAPEWLH